MAFTLIFDLLHFGFRMWLWFRFEQKYWRINVIGEKKAQIGRFAYPYSPPSNNDVWRSDPDSLCFKNYRQWCYPVERENCRMVMRYKSLLTFINTTAMYQSNRSFNIPPPRAAPRAFQFLENFCSNFPLTGPKSCSNAPTSKQNYQITVLTFQ